MTSILKRLPQNSYYLNFKRNFLSTLLYTFNEQLTEQLAVEQLICKQKQVSQTYGLAHVIFEKIQQKLIKNIYHKGTNDIKILKQVATQNMEAKRCKLVKQTCYSTKIINKPEPLQGLAPREICKLLAQHLQKIQTAKCTWLNTETQS